MTRLLPLAAILVCALLLPSGASAHFTTTGYSDIRQDGAAVRYTLGLESEALFELADGNDRAALSAYLLPRVRVSADGGACTGKLDRVTPERRSGVDYVRLALSYGCPSESGPFAVRYAVPAENVARYQLGGAEGSYAFDPDNIRLTVDSPGFSRFVEKGIEHIVLGWDHVVFLVILLLGARKLRDVIELATAFTVAHSITLALAILGIVDVPASIVEPLIAASIVFVAAQQVLGVDSRKRLAIVFGFGLLHGLGFAGAVSFPDGTPILSALIGFNLGIELGQAMIVAVVFPLLLALRRFEWSNLAHAATGSAAAALGLFWLSQRILGG